MSVCMFCPDGAPCGAPAVEVLVYLNPLCGGGPASGFRACGDCFAAHLLEHDPLLHASCAALTNNKEK